MIRRERGFTLVEMLAALAVSALLISLVYGAIIVAQRSAQAVQREVDRSETMHIAWAFLERAIAQARVVANPDDGSDRTGFSGGSGHLAFVAEPPTYIGSGGLARIALRIDDEDQQQRLQLRLAPYPPMDDDDAASASTATLLDDLGELEIAYLGRLPGDTVARWHDDWVGEQRLPALVRIRISDASGRAWPELIARPLQGMPVIEAGDGQDASPIDDSAGDMPEDEMFEAHDAS